MELLDQPLALDLLGQPAFVGQAQKEAAQPVGEVAADQEQVALLQLAKKRGRHLAAAGDEVVRVFQNVFVVDCKHRRCARLAKQVEQLHLTGPRVPIGGQVAAFAGGQFGRMDDLVDRALLTQAAGEQIVRRQRHKQPEVGDLGELANGYGNGGIARCQFAHDVVNIGIQILRMGDGFQLRHRGVQLAKRRQFVQVDLDFVLA